MTYITLLNVGKTVCPLMFFMIDSKEKENEMSMKVMREFVCPCAQVCACVGV